MIPLAEFERAMLVHMDAAFNLAYWILRDRDDAEDVVQDAYMRAFRAFQSRTGDDPRPWLLAIVRNVAYRWLAVRKRRSNVIPLDNGAAGHDRPPPAEHIAADAPSAEALLIGKAEQALVHRALAELPPAYREVIILRELEDMSYQEIATVTGVPLGTVMSRLARAREQLRLQLRRLMAKEDKNAL